MPNGNTDNVLDHTDDNSLTPSVQEGISDYIKALKSRHDNWIERARIALKHFAESIEKGAVEQGGSDLIATVILTAIKFGSKLLIDEIAGKVPGGSIFVSFTRQVIENLEERVDASGVSVLDFVQNEESSLLLLKQAFDHNLTLSFQEDLEVGFMGSGDPDGFIADLDISIRAAGNSSTLPHPDRLERVIMEEWINRHFSQPTDDGMGCIDFRIEATKAGASISSETASVTLKVPHGSKLAPKLNSLIDAGHADLDEVSDLAVLKRICYCVDELGGNQWDCGWIDEENRIIHQPLTGVAQEFLEKNVGFRHITNFRTGAGGLSNETSCADTGFHNHIELNVV